MVNGEPSATWAPAPRDGSTGEAPSYAGSLANASRAWASPRKGKRRLAGTAPSSYAANWTGTFNDVQWNVAWPRA